MSFLQNIKKRDGSLVAFDQQKITEAIWKAAQSVGGTNQELAQKISHQVTAVLEIFFKNSENVPTVEQIQDLVEKILIENGHAKTAKAYILYRQKQTDLRKKKEKILGRTAATKFSLAALKLLKQHFLVKAEDGTTIETPEEMMERVAKSVAAADKNYKDPDSKASERQFYQALTNLDFLPQSSIMANAGTSHPQLLSFYELQVQDSMESIFEEIKHAVLIYQSGAKALVNLSKLRPKGTSVASTKGPASGPVAFLKIFDSAINAIKQASKQGSLTAMLAVDHPDILEFASCQDEGKKLEHFQIYIGLTEGFMEALLKQKEYELVNPQNGKVITKLDAQSVFDILISKIEEGKELSLVFMNKEGVLKAIEPQNNRKKKSEESPAEDTYQIFAHGAINIAHCTENGIFDWQKFEKLIHSAIHFLDNVFDISKYPSEQIAQKARQERRIGLGICGFAELLENLHPENSAETQALAEKISFFLKEEAQKASEHLAEKRGSNLGTKLRNKNLIAINPDTIVSSIAEKTPGINMHKSDPETNIRIQAVFQKNSDGIIDSIIEFPEKTDAHALKTLALLSYQAGCHTIRLVKSKTLLATAKNTDEQIELPFHKIVDETAQRKAKREAQENREPAPPKRVVSSPSNSPLGQEEERVHHKIVAPQKAEEVVPPPIIINA